MSTVTATPVQNDDFEVAMFRKAYNITDPAAPAAEPAPTEPTATPEAVATPEPTQTEPTPIETETWWSKLGFQSEDAVKEALQKKPEVQEPQFANDTSRQLYDLIVNGKEDEVAEVLATRRQLNSLNLDNNENVLKAYIKFQNPEFDELDVEEEYAEKYALDPELEFDDSRKRREEKKLKQRIQQDVAAAKDFFDKKKQELKLPEISKAAPATEPQETNEEDAMYRQKFVESLSKFSGVKPIQFEYKDESNTAIPIRYEPDAEGVKEIKQLLEQDGGFFQFLGERHFSEEGGYKIDQMVTDFYLLKNWNKILDSAVSQAVNKTKLELLKNQKNIPEPVSTGALPQDIQQDAAKAAAVKLFFS